MSGVSHGLGLGLGFLHIVELWFWHLQRPSLSLGLCYKFIISGCTIIVILYQWSGVRGIPWSRVRVRVLAHSRVMVLVFTGS